MAKRIGRYTLTSTLGQGGMGAVYAAQDTASGAAVAIKVLSAGASANSDQRARFRREVSALQRVAHPNLVRILDAGEERGVPWLAMERVEGESLEERIRLGPLDVDDAIAVALQLCSALEAVHAQGLLHRDLKPDNVMIRPSGQAVLTDFGLAKDLEVAASVELSRTGILTGTPGYWAPEQAGGESRESDVRTDVYGLGATLYALVTGRPPVTAPSLHEAIIATMEHPPPRPSKLRSELPLDLEALLLRCLEKDPARRYGTVLEVRQALECVSLAPPRRSRAAPALALVAVVGLAGFVVAHTARRDSRPATSATPRVTFATVVASPAPSPSPPVDSAALASERAQDQRDAEREAARRLAGEQAFLRGKEAYSRKDRRGAAAAFREASQLGHLRSKGFLALLYSRGEGVPRDDARAIALWKQAATGGDPESMADLYYAYSKGVGVVADLEEAFHWAREGALAGHAESMGSLGSCYFQGKGVAQDYAKAIQWLSEGSAKGNGPATSNLAAMHANGLGVTQDRREALRLLRLAVDQGFPTAQRMIEQLLKQHPELR